MKRQATEQEKISANNMTDKGLICKMYQQFMQLDIKKNKPPNLKMGRPEQKFFIYETCAWSTGNIVNYQ